MKQVVPVIPRLKTSTIYYGTQTQKDILDYVFQKYIDRVFVNTSYNPKSTMKKSYEFVVATSIMFYKYGGKQLYYNNTHDGQGEIDIEKEEGRKVLEVNMVTVDTLKTRTIATVVKYNDSI